MRLGAAVLVQAYHDIAHGDRVTALDAVYWLAFDDTAAVLCEVLDLPDDPLYPLGRKFFSRRNGREKQTKNFEFY